MIVKAKSIFFFAILILTSQSILMTLRKQDSRCMIEFIMGSGQYNSVKMKIIFPELYNEVPGEHFFLSLRNLENNKTVIQTIKPGTKYIKEEQLQINVIYEHCITFKTQRDIEAVIDYQSQSHYGYKQETIKVPQELLTKNDFRDAYISANNVKNLIGQLNNSHVSRKNEQQKQFAMTEGINRKMTILSGVQMVVLIAAGLYQFLALKNFLVSRFYI